MKPPDSKKFVRALMWLLLPIASIDWLPAQRYREFGIPYFKKYTPQQMEAQTQNWDIVQDHRGLLYVGNNQGILEFDGAVWSTIPLRNSLVARSLAIDGTGRIHYGGLGEIGYVTPSQDGELQCVSLVDQLPEADRSFQMVHQTLVDWHRQTGPISSRTPRCRSAKRPI